MTRLLLLTTLLIGALSAPSVHAAERILLWPQGQAPGEIVDAEDSESRPARPTLDLYPVDKDKANGCAVVVCPGGGYGGLAMDHEGKQVGEFFNSHGVSAFVLRYRHSPQYKHPAPMLDVHRALRYVRANADKYGIDPKRIGVMGFSAGGHLASTAATHFDDGDANAADPIDRVSCRPDFAILCYPVISIDTTKPYTHKGSSYNLVGKEPDPALIEQLSNARQVTKDTPPCFIFQTDADTAVPAENSVYFYLALREHKIPAEMHIFRPGRHGLGLAPNDPVLKVWPDLLINWMNLMKYLGE
ncbi:MAG: alpha/beta hydrolase fold domain-containing protein [Phycisphaera sp.]|nr:alpha/beta hydrolase fold domain-containing protein [Phycisphaera sp.]